MMKMRLSSASYIVFLVMLFVFSADMTASVLPRVGEGDSLVRKSIYPPSATRKSDLYNKLWGCQIIGGNKGIGIDYRIGIPDKLIQVSIFKYLLVIDFLEEFRLDKCGISA